MDPALIHRLQQQPDATFPLIARVTGDLDDRARIWARRGLRIRRRLGLIGALAIDATGRQALSLREDPQVVWIEEDREVQTSNVPDNAGC
jgi:hypothetical protein